MFGIVLVLAAQLSLGASWRIGIDEAEATTLVTTGAFQVVRNPIFTTVILTFLGLALMVPNPLAVAGVVVTVIGIEVQVRLAEEPYLRRVHGTAYTDYASRVGRSYPASAACNTSAAKHLTMWQGVTVAGSFPADAPAR